MKSDQFYHVFNHCNGKENLFESFEHYTFFLQRTQRFLAPVAEVHAYCLMPNHFHLLIRVHDEITLINRLLQNKNIREILKMDGYEKALYRLKTIDPSIHVRQQFSNLFNSYAQAFNKAINRKGNLFRKRF